MELLKQQPQDSFPLGQVPRGVPEDEFERVNSRRMEFQGSQGIENLGPVTMT